jgi:putative transcriptional regulator
VKTRKRTRLGREQAFKELAAYPRGEIEVEPYDVRDDSLSPARIKAIRRSVAASTREFERRFGVPARTLEAYEQGRRRPDAAVKALLRVIVREPAAVRRALGNKAA